jgi:putative glycosyltransferase (TIGR04372 family)
MSLTPNGFFDWHGLRTARDPFISVPERTQGLGNIFTDSLGWERDTPWACFTMRDSFWYEKHYGDGVFESLQAHRNTPGVDFIPAIENTLSEGFFVVRMGRSQSPFPFKHERLLDYALLAAACPELDHFFFAGCSFAFHVGTGITDLAMIYQKPRLEINFVDLLRMNPQEEKVTYLPQLIYHGKTNKLLTLQEICELRPDRHSYGPALLGESNLKFRRCTPDEIRDAVINLTREVKNGASKLNNDSNQAQWWRRYREQVTGQLQGRAYARIDPQFFRKHEGFFDCSPDV